jgi:hypothetical protein
MVLRDSVRRRLDQSKKCTLRNIYFHKYNVLPVPQMFPEKKERVIFAHVQAVRQKKNPHSEILKNI